MDDLTFFYSSAVPESSSETDFPLALFAYSDDSTVSIVDPENLYGHVLDTILRLKFAGKSEEIQRIWSDADQRTIYVVGLGEKSTAPEATADVNGADTSPLSQIRKSAGAFARQINDFEQAAVYFPEADEKSLTALIEGLGLGSYRYNTYRSEKQKVAVKSYTVTASLSEDVAKRSIENAQIMIAAVNEAKDLVNMPAADLYPENFAEKVSEGVNELPITVQTWDEKQLAAEGFGGLLGVGRGSERPPRLVKLIYAPEQAKKHLALVGKGITFDTGGLSLKPANAMVGMKYDMTGAATVFSAIKAIAQLALPIKVTAWLCLAENMPSGSATRPNDVLTIFGGKTVEVLNTDAEGRLVLADGLVAASNEYPDHIIDVATLTGAATVAVGNYFTPVLGNDDFVNEVIRAGAETGEQFWQLPLDKQLRKILDSDIADIANARPGNPAGGTITGALFLADFVGSKSAEDNTPISWVHLDIAPTANSDSPSGFTGKGATGVAVRALVQIAANLN